MADHSSGNEQALVPPESRQASGVSLALLGALTLRVGGQQQTLSNSSARLLAYMALAAPRPVARCQLAGTLWPAVNEARAAANLRSGLWRLRKACDRVVACTPTTVKLSDTVKLDIGDIAALVHATWVGQAASERIQRSIPELLPGWYDEWVVYERERLRQSLLHNIEEACTQLISQGAYTRAIDLGHQIIAAEPLRETPNRLVIAAHLAEGNQSEAHRHLAIYEGELRRELGVAPSASLVAMVRSSLVDVSVVS